MPLRLALRSAPLVAVLMTGAAACAPPQRDAVLLPDCLDLPAIYALVGPESLGLRDWDDAIELGRQMGSRTVDDLPDARLSVYGPGEESGTFDTFAELAIAPIAEQRGIPDDEALPRPDYTSSPNDNVIIDGVAGTPGSLGWVGQAFLDEESGSVRAFEIAAPGGPCVAPTDRAIASGDYPLARDLYVYVDAEAAARSAAVAAFIEAHLDSGGREAVTEAGYVALTDADMAESRQAWARAVPGGAEPDADLSGRVRASGSSTVEPISSIIAEQFSRDHPRVTISIDGPGTGDGFELFCGGEVDVTNASRPITDEERRDCEATGVDPVELRVAIDGLSVVTSA